MPTAEELSRIAELGVDRARPMREFRPAGWIQISGGSDEAVRDADRLICHACAWFVDGALRARRG